MDNPWILKLNQVDRHSIAIVGGKGANLGELISNQFPVPDGYCVTVNAYKIFIEENRLDEKINQIIDLIDWKNPVDIEHHSAKIRGLIEDYEIASDMESEIIRAYKQMDNVRNGKGYVAVRSSATAEDLPDSSFAGQQETYLYVNGEKELIHYVKSCWASLWSTRAMSYRHKKNYDHRKVYISVVIQEMVDATVSGILFTNNPLSQNRNEIYISSSYGLGELIVSGQITPDSFIIDKNNRRVKHQELGTKEKELIMGTTERTTLLEVSPGRRDAYSLTQDQLKELGGLALKVEQHYDFPQDMEWAFAEGKLYLLQARPITTLNNSDSLNQTEQVDFGKISPTQVKILDDLLEHYPEAPTPLDYALVSMSYQALLDRGKELGISLSQATEIIHIDQEGKINLNPPQINVKSKILFLLPKLIKAAKDHDHTWSQLEIEFHSFIKNMNGLGLENISNQKLVAEIEQLFNLAKKINDFRFRLIVDSTMVPLFTISTIIKLFTSKKNRPVISDIITTNLNYKTSIIDKKLTELAIKISENQEVRRFILNSDYKFLEEFKLNLSSIANGKDTWEEIQSFLNQYGYRTDKMYQPFISKSWLDDPIYFLDVFKAVLNDPQLFERKKKEQERNQRHQQWLTEFENRLKSPIKGQFKSSYEKLRKIYIYREETVFLIETLFHYGRKLITELGIRLEKKGVLNDSSEIIYLFREELAALSQEERDIDRIKKLIGQRKENLKRNQWIWKQSIIQLSKASIEDDDVITGISGSNGIAEGPVRIITKVEDFKKLKQGEILVCQYTDPAWTPLFGIAGAIVADTGGPLSHAAIVAREYEIPAVLGTKIGTSSLKDGEYILVDGTTGKVMKKLNNQTTVL